MKRGPRPFDLRHNALMPVSMIAARLDISARTVAYDLKKALLKLKADRNQFTLVVATIHAVATDPADITAASAECRREFVAKWMGGSR